MTSEDPLSADEYRTLARFRHALRAFLRFSEDAARNAGTTPAQHQLLLAIAGHDPDSPPSLGDIAEALQLRLHSAGELVGRAVDNGLVERHPDPVDQRRVLLGLTDAGWEILGDLSVQHREELRAFRRDMNDLLRRLDPPSGSD